MKIKFKDFNNIIENPIKSVGQIKMKQMAYYKKSSFR